MLNNSRLRKAVGQAVLIALVLVASVLLVVLFMPALALVLEIQLVEYLAVGAAEVASYVTVCVVLGVPAFTAFLYYFDEE